MTATAPFPSTFQVNLAAIPGDIKRLAQWVCWRYVDKRGNITKIPVDPHTGDNAKINDPTTWATFEEAVAYAKAHSSQLCGLMFAITTDDPYTIVDLDDCRDFKSSPLTMDAQQIIDGLSSYTERSPSETGVHIFVRGSLPPMGRKRGDVEMYDSRRYVTVTGQHLDGTPETIEVRQAELTALHERVFGAAEQQPTAGGHDAEERSHFQGTGRDRFSDENLIARAKAATNGDKFARLWCGDRTGYASESEADLALCRLIAFWTGPDEARIDRIFRQSRLYREKWERADYRERTIATALKGMDEFWEPLPRALTDSGNAERLTDAHGHDLRYCAASNSWLVWDGTRWRIDDTGEIYRRAKQTVRRIHVEAGDEADYERRKALATLALRSESEASINHMVSLARHEPGVAVRPVDLDADPWLLNVENGTIDLRTGELREHRREDLITMIAPVRYDANARSDMWTKFLERILPDAETRAFVQRAVGYSLTGDTGEEQLFFAFGPAATGKSTLLAAVIAVLGDYSATADFETFLSRNGGGGPRNDIARLAGKRLVVSLEVDEGKKFAEGLVKALTGGDKVAARFLYKESFEFKPSFKLWLAANHRPAVKDDDDAMWRRITQIPFRVQIPEDERDPQVKATLGDPAKSGAAILAWAVQGCLDWQAHGLREPQAVKDATNEYRQEMNPIADFLDDECVFGAEQQVPKAELFEAYTRYAAENSERNPLTKGRFGERLKQKGIADTKSGVWRWLGIGLRLE